MQSQPSQTSSATSGSPVQAATESRRYELDWLRVVVVLGLIPYHVAVVFAVGPGDYIQNSQRSLAFDVGATLVAFLGMPLLFVIAGAATWYALGRRKPTTYLKERLRRLAVPLVFGILVLVPVQLYYDRLNGVGYSQNYLQFYGQFLVDWVHITQLGVFGHGFQYWGHLWFLIYLLAVSIFLLPLLSWLRRGSGAHFAAQVAQIAERPVGLLALGVPLGLVEVVLQGPIGPLPAMDYSNLYSGAAGLVLYAVAFVLGYILVPDATFRRAIVRYRAHLLALGLLLLTVHELALGAPGMPTLSGPLALPTIRLLRGLITWCLMAAAVGYASRYLSAGSHLLDSVNEACFPIYVLHMPILTIVAFYVVRLEAPVLVKFVMILLLTAVGTFLLYEEVVRRFSVTRFLFGLKSAAPESEPIPAAPACSHTSAA